MAGYSDKSLKEKLGIKEEFDCLFINAPQWYFDEVKKESSNKPDSLDLIHIFLQSQKELMQILELKDMIKQNGAIWVSWAKKSSVLYTDLNENIIRDFALKNGLVDVKVCAVSEDWSVLKLVIPVKYRKA